MNPIGPETVIAERTPRTPRGRRVRRRVPARAPACRRRDSSGVAGAARSSGPDAKRAMHGGDHVAPRLRRAGFAVVGAVAPKIVTDTGKPHWTAPRCTGYSRGCGIALRDELGPRARVAAHRRPPRRRCRHHRRRAPLAARRRRAAAGRPRAARDDRAADEALSGDGSGGPSAARWYSRYAVRYGRVFELAPSPVARVIELIAPAAWHLQVGAHVPGSTTRFSSST